MSIDVNARDAVLEQARGVLAERFGVRISTADAILHEVALAQRCGIGDLAAAVVASCTTDTAALPRNLYPSAACRSTKGAA